MTLIPSTAASAVYHDALTTARGWRNLCFLLLLLILLAQLGLFLAARFTDGVIPVEGDSAKSGQTEIPSIDINATEQTELEADGDVDTDTDIDVNQSTATVDSDFMQDLLYMVLYFTLWGGLVFCILMSLTLVFTTLVMLNGRTVGVSREVSAFFWSLILLLLLIPWQAILNHPTFAGGPFHVPGVLYTWAELEANGEQFQEGRADWLGWVRFVVWPVAALFVLFVVQAKARRGVKEALGEDLAVMDEPLRDRPLA
jgi:hypothetical protein